ncbi:glycosyltransferase [Microbacterium terrisoli]|uniref:glycosyltransferase n=1 Tax=Microbacterium terrisoli TaxID=3242192 RepID=UPI002803C9BE|nr:glycosyltransferase [Microbacterium protaetiae]
MKRHLLLTAWAFAPARTSGVYRAIGMANAFAGQGWDVTVLAADEAVFSVEGTVDSSLSGQVDSHIRVVRVPFTSGVYARDIGQWSRAQARHPELWGMGHGLPFPETGFGDWRPALTRAAEDVYRGTPVDLTIGTASPSVDFIPGWHLKRRHGVPMLMDYRDAWTIDVFTGGRNPRATARAERWERRFLAAADQVWFVNEPIRSWHAAKYPTAAGRMRVVPNGFDLVGGVSPAVPFAPVPDERPLVFGYIGTINVGQFPAESLLEGWRRARTRSPELARARLVLRGHLGRSGVAGEALDGYLRRAEQDGIVYAGPVAKADVAEAYATFDALVLALASGPGVTSGKVFEFAATGLPVVSVHEPASAATTIMRESPVWVPAVSMSADDVASALIAGAALVRSQSAATRAQAVEWGAQWERARQLDAGVAGASELLDGQLQIAGSQKERKQ